MTIILFPFQQLLDSADLMQTRLESLNDQNVTAEPLVSTVY